MKHEAIDDLLSAQARRELREAPAGLAARVQLELGAARREPVRAGRARRPLALAASLAAAALLAWNLWPRPVPVGPAAIVEAPALPSAPALAIDLTQRGIQFAARIDSPLADEWQRMVQNSLQLRDSLLGQLPSLPR